MGLSWTWWRFSCGMQIRQRQHDLYVQWSLNRCLYVCTKLILLCFEVILGTSFIEFTKHILIVTNLTLMCSVVNTIIGKVKYYNQCWKCQILSKTSIWVVISGCFSYVNIGYKTAKIASCSKFWIYRSARQSCIWVDKRYLSTETHQCFAEQFITIVLSRSAKSGGLRNLDQEPNNIAWGRLKLNIKLSARQDLGKSSKPTIFCLRHPRAAHTLCCDQIAIVIAIWWNLIEKNRHTKNTAKQNWKAPRMAREWQSLRA